MSGDLPNPTGRGPGDRRGDPAGSAARGRAASLARDAFGPPPFGAEEAARARSKRALREAMLVLDANGIGYTVEVSRFGGARILVGALDAERAREEIGSYAEENEAWPPPDAPTPPRLSDGVLGAMVFAALVCALHFIEKRAAFGIDWWGQGMMHAAGVRDGEWWRTITSLTLHADAQHLVGNIVFGSLFGAIAAQGLGTGLTWFGTLLAGSLGHVCETYVVEPTHRGIGASTAVFGTLGMMVAAEWARRGAGKMPWVRRVAPLFAGAVIFGWVGAGGGETEDPGGSRTDVLAHVLGFAVGAGLGVLAAKSRLAERIGARGQMALAWLALGGVLAAWCVAISARS